MDKASVTVELVPKQAEPDDMKREKQSPGHTAGVPATSVYSKFHLGFLSCTSYNQHGSAFDLLATCIQE